MSMCSRRLGVGIFGEGIDDCITMAVKDIIKYEWLKVSRDKGAGLGNPQYDVVLDILAVPHVEIRLACDKVEVFSPRFGHCICII